MSLYSQIDELESQNKTLRERVRQLESEYERIWFELRDAIKRPDNRPKLDPETVAEIRRFGRTAGLSNQELADMYSVNRSTISRIRRRIYHKDVA